MVDAIFLLRPLLNDQSYKRNDINENYEKSNLETVVVIKNVPAKPY